MVLVGSGSTGVRAPARQGLEVADHAAASPSYIYEIENNATPSMRFASALPPGITFRSVCCAAGCRRDDIIFVAFRACQRFPMVLPPPLALDDGREGAAQELHPALQPMGAAHSDRDRLQGSGSQRQGRPQDRRDRALHRLRGAAEERRRAEMRRLHPRHRLRTELPQVPRRSRRRRSRPGGNQFLQGPDDGRRAELLPAGRRVALGLDAALGDLDALRGKDHTAHGNGHTQRASTARACITLRRSRRTTSCAPSERMPRLCGTYELPSVDNLLCYRFNPRRFKFS